MSVTRVKVAEDSTSITYEVRDGTNVIGTDVEAKPTSEMSNYAAIADAARNALVANRTYIGTASPTAAQTTAQVKALSRQVNALIRLALNLLDGTD